MSVKQSIMQILQEDNVFLTGGGGVGKSYLCEEIISSYRQNFKQVVVLGSTGISAVQVGGQTFHSFFCFGIANNIEQMKQNDKKLKRKLDKLKKILQKCDLLVIDEISMISSELLDMMRYRLESLGFDGRILLVGDFFQLPPVRKKETKVGLFGDNVYAFESLAWEYYDFKVAHLTKPKRTHDMEFFSILEELRHGRIDAKVMAFLENLRENVDVWRQNPTILFGRNKEADIMNKRRLIEVESEHFTFPSIDKIYDENLHSKKLDSWKKSLMISENLELKVGASVLFCVNKPPEYYNGERGEVINIDSDAIVVRKDDGSEIEVKRYEFVLNEIIRSNDDILESPLACVKQFPLKLAYAITIHKSQGMSIKKLVCNVEHIFEKSQFYVALSRAINPKELFLYYNRDDFLAHVKKSVKVDEKVVDFYKNCDKIFIEE